MTSLSANRLPDIRLLRESSFHLITQLVNNAANPGGVPRPQTCHVGLANLIGQVYVLTNNSAYCASFFSVSLKTSDVSIIPSISSPPYRVTTRHTFIHIYSFRGKGSD